MHFSFDRREETSMNDYDNFFLPVTDMNKAKEFYSTVLGLPVKFDFSERGMVAFPVGNQEPALIVKDVHTFPDAIQTIWFVVDDVNRDYERLKESGVRFLSEPFPIPTGLAVEFTDPFGNRLEITDYSVIQSTVRHDAHYTACCGLFCHDCFPSNVALFSALEQLETLLAALHFSDYARLKAQTNETLKAYPTFLRVLHEIKELRCKAPCQEGGGKPDCAIKHCVERKHYTGCWECPDVSRCELLAPLKEFHGETIDHNLTMIQRYGRDNWSDKRGRHYRWS
jgi:predicted enzyme related to lactoylglutathione lyase